MVVEPDTKNPSTFGFSHRGEGGACFELLHNSDDIEIIWPQQIKMCTWDQVSSSLHDVVVVVVDDDDDDDNDDDIEHDERRTKRWCRAQIRRHGASERIFSERPAMEIDSFIDLGV